MNIHNQNKNLIKDFRAALYDLAINNLEKQLKNMFAPDAKIQLAFPFETLTGSEALLEHVYLPLIQALPDLERRDYIVMAGAGDGKGLPGNWVGCAGFYTGVFENAWLDIPPTHHPVTMRFHEFFRVEDNKILEMQALWDIPEFMMQARAWPMTPSLGVEWLVPGPATQDGVITQQYDAEPSGKSRQLVHDMLNGLQRHAEHGAEAMGLASYWHPSMLWYGPAGIGTTRRVAGFRNWHQIPFLKALPDREVTHGNGVLFADGAYVAFTGWPGMKMTISGDGWLGIAPANQTITMRSLDFWRCEHGHDSGELGIDRFAACLSSNRGGCLLEDARVYLCETKEIAWQRTH